MTLSAVVNTLIALSIFAVGVLVLGWSYNREERRDDENGERYTVI